MSTVTLKKRTQTGVTMIEVLVSVLVLSLGLLGMAALQGVSIQTNQSANFRSQAVYLAQDMLDSMRVNPGRTSATNTAVAPNPPVWVTAYTAHLPFYARVYGGSVQTTNALATADVTGWLQRIARELPAGDGQIAVNGRVVTVSIRWSDQRFAERFGFTGTDADLTEYAYEITI